MLRKTVSFLLAGFLVVSLPLSASAHSGRTDSNGGHTDHSTGEYHYHHGYPAHQHTDKNGDGIPDCPYDFVDKTGQSSGSSSSGSSSSSYSHSSSSSSSSASKKSSTATTKTTTSTWSEVGLDASFFALLALCAIILICTVAFVPLVVKFLSFLIDLLS